MSENITFNRYETNDGRRAEQRFIERQDESGNKERIVETHVEQIPFMISERVVEKLAPVITERRKETYSNGVLLDTVVEQVPHSGFKLTKEMSPVEETVTKSDIEEIIRSALAEILSEKQLDTDFADPIVEENPIVSPEPIKKSFWSSWGDIILYVILSGELAFIVYQGFLKGLIEK